MSKAHRRLTDSEIEEAMQQAKKKGLPEEWTVIWDDKRQKRIWLSPDKSRKCYSIPQALAYSAKLGLVKRNDLPPTVGHRKLSPEEVKSKLEEGKKRGLPDGWTIVWDNMFHQRVWVSPDGSKKCKGIPQALAASVKLGLITRDELPTEQNTKRVLTDEEIEEAMNEAKAQGLPKGWTVEWNPSKKKRRWVTPDKKRKCNSIPEALRISVRKGLLSSMTRTPQIKKKRKHIPSGNRELTEAEVKASLEEAKTRGLSGGWAVEWSNELHRRLWICPKGVKYENIADALALQPSTTANKKRKKKKKQQAEEHDNVADVVHNREKVSYVVCI